MAPAGEQTGSMSKVVTGLVVLSLIAAITGTKLWEQPRPDCNTVTGNSGSNSYPANAWTIKQDLAKTSQVFFVNRNYRPMGL